MLIGEAPGYYEDLKGQPFVGKSGRYLDDRLGSINLSRANLWICNTVCCRPPDNRDPMPKEIAACREHVESQIQLIDPKLIVTLGRFSAAIFFKHSRVKDLHGKVRLCDAYGAKRLVFSMYHPAAAMHNPTTKVDIEADFIKLGTLIRNLRLIGYL